MKIGFIGLGRMGANMVKNLLEHKHKIVGYNRSPEKTKKLIRNGIIPAYTLKEIVNKLPSKKIIWLMVPAGKIVDNTIKSLLPMLKKGDIIIDGGNSFYKDSIKRHKALKKKGINYLDCGTSGGMEGARYGACMMIGGDKTIFKKTERLYKDMCVKNGYGYMGESGMGHFVKMIHNEIEYGMMSAINEGLLAIEKYSKKADINTVTKVYAHGSIIESKLMSWMFEAFETKNFLKNISNKVPKGETEDEMNHVKSKFNVPVLNASVKMRENSRKNKFKGKYIAAMRNLFGGHKVIKK